MLVQRALVLPVDHLPAPGQEHDHVGLDLVHGVQPLVRPRLVVRGLARLQRGSVAGGGHGVARAHELDLRPVHDATAEDPLVREDVAVPALVGWEGEPDPEGQRDRVAEQEDPHRCRAHGRARQRRRGCRGAAGRVDGTRKGGAGDCRRAGGRRDDRDQHGPHPGGHRQPRPPRADEGPHADRALDEVEGHDRHPERDEHPHGEELVAGDPGTGVIEPDEDRPVPDVEAVGDPPHVAHRRQRQHAGDDAPGRGDGGQDDAADGEADEEEAARVGERGRRRGRHPECDGHDRAGQADQAADRPPGRAGRLPQLPLGQAALLLAAPRQQHEPDGERAPDEEALGAGVGAEIGPVGVDAAVVQHVHPGGGRDGRRTAQREQGPQAPREVHDAQHHQWPDHVELLLDGQRPGVQER